MTVTSWRTWLAAAVGVSLATASAPAPRLAAHAWSAASLSAGAPRSAHYAASKAGVIAFTKSLAVELAPDNITVNCVCPGATDTPMSRIGFTPEQFRKTAEEVAGVDLKEWFRKAVSSVEELDYAEALDWFGLRFATADSQQPSQGWKLEMREDATEAQKRRGQVWLGSRHAAG